VSDRRLIPIKSRDIPLFATAKDVQNRMWREGLNIIEPEDPDLEVRRLLATQHILDFTTYTFPQYIVDPFHAHVASALDRVVFKDDPDYQYVMLFAPPQHGKSELVSTRLPAFFMAHNPNDPVALVSYAAKLADRNSRAARSVLQDPRFAELPFQSNIRPDLDNWRVYDWHILGGKAFSLAVGVGGAITGHGFGLIVIDDPIESWAHAQSEVIRESTWQWWLGTLKTRLWEGGRIVLMMTRWHKDDLAGRILEEEGRVEEGGRWKVLSYAALAQRPQYDDETKEIIPASIDVLGREFEAPLAPSRFSQNYLMGMRATQAKMVWNAEYQQVPTDPEGDFFKIGRIDIEDTPPLEICRIHEGYPVDIQKGIRFWDLAATAKSRAARDPDYLSGTLMAEGERRFWLLDEQRGQLDPEQVFDLVILTAKNDGPNVKIRIEQEPGAAGKTLIQAYVKALAGYDVAGVPASGDKITRAQPFASQVNAGNVVMLKGKWNKPMLAELAGFPNVRHDDQVDSGAGAFNEIAAEEKRWREMEFLSV
jgi:predicted phage terminase large subunit-like protein